MHATYQARSTWNLSSDVQGGVTTIMSNHNRRVSLRRESDCVRRSTCRAINLFVAQAASCLCPLSSSQRATETGHHRDEGLSRIVETRTSIVSSSHCGRDGEANAAATSSARFVWSCVATKHNHSAASRNTCVPPPCSKRGKAARRHTSRYSGWLQVEIRDGAKGTRRGQVNNRMCGKERNQFNTNDSHFTTLPDFHRPCKQISYLCNKRDRKVRIEHKQRRVVLDACTQDCSNANCLADASCHRICARQQNPSSPILHSRPHSPRLQRSIQNASSTSPKTPPLRAMMSREMLGGTCESNHSFSFAGKKVSCDRIRSVCCGRVCSLKQGMHHDQRGRRRKKEVEERRRKKKRHREIHADTEDREKEGGGRGKR